MSFKLKPIARGIALACGGAASVLAVTLPAQAQTSAPAPQRLERVEVTGSMLRRIEGETALPVTTIQVEELVKAGVTNAEQAVRYITQAQGGTVTSSSVSGTNGAAAYVDLRSLGANRTLVLLNGRRVTQNPFSVTAVDLNTLPLAAVERIETLSDGASATYGTDAIAGVVNFITRKDYKGLAVSAQAQIPQAGGGETYIGTLLGGWGDYAKQGWNVYGGLSFRSQDHMFGTERDFSRTSYIPERGYNAMSPTTFPANYSQTVGGVTVVSAANPTVPNCRPPYSLYAPQPGVGLGTTRCGADTQTFTWTIPEQEQTSAFLKGSLALGKDHNAYAEYFWSRNKVTTTIAPSPESGLTMTPLSPYYPGNGITPNNAPTLNTTQPISIAWRTVPLGSRSGEQENNTQRIVLGVDGLVMGWDYNVAYLWSNAKVENFFLNGYPMTQPLRDGVRGVNGAPFLNPFGDQSAAGLAYLQANQVLGKVQDGESTLQSLSGQVTRQFGMLAGGPMSIGIGAEFRKEEMVYNTDIPKVSQAASSGLAGSGALRQGDRDITALALEMNFPVLKGLELGVALRYDDYSDFGSTTNPKFSVRYSPTSTLLLRGSYNKGFSAPSLYNLYLPNSTTFTASRFNDPVLCPNGVPAAGAVPARDCGIQFQQLQGGNTQLQPEKSDAWTVGFVWQATNAVSFGVDYWYYYIKDSISTVGEETVFADPVKYANLYVRCSQAPAARQQAIGACQTPGGDPLAYILNTFQNLGDTRTSGIDWQFNWTGGATAYGRFGVNMRGTYVMSYQFQVEPQGTWFDPVGKYSPQFGGPVIRYQQVSSVNWESNAWSATLFNRWQSGYFDQNGSGATAAFKQHEVGNYSLWDISGSYRGFKNLTLQAGILNLLDTDPPFTNQTSRFQARAYDDRFHNPLGRTWMLGAKYEF